MWVSVVTCEEHKKALDPLEMELQVVSNLLTHPSPLKSSKASQIPLSSYCGFPYTS